MAGTWSSLASATLASATGTVALPAADAAGSGKGLMAKQLSRMKTMNHCATVGRAVPCAPRMQSTLHPAAARTE
jgi:hypothetical protein